MRQTPTPPADSRVTRWHPETIPPFHTSGSGRSWPGRGHANRRAHAQTSAVQCGDPGRTAPHIPTLNPAVAAMQGAAAGHSTPPSVRQIALFRDAALAAILEYGHATLHRGSAEGGPARAELSVLQPGETKKYSSQASIRIGMVRFFSLPNRLVSVWPSEQPLPKLKPHPPFTLKAFSAYSR